MPRPTTKKDLLAQSQKNQDALIAFVDGLSPADRERDFKPGTMNRNMNRGPTILPLSGNGISQLVEVAPGAIHDIRVRCGGLSPE